MSPSYLLELYRLSACDFESVDPKNTVVARRRKIELDDNLRNQTFWETHRLQYVRSGAWD